MLATKEVFIVPLKSFDVAKERLRRGGIDDVAGLARNLAAGVIRHCAPRHVVVLSESSDVTAFAEELGAEVLESDASNLNEAVQGAYKRLSGRCERIIVVHGDLQEPEGLGEYHPEAGITIVTDHLSRGTNVLVVPIGIDFRFQYGENSARLHRLEAERLDVAWRLITDSPWRFDVDEPGDVQRP